jgi:hypothetical protein
LCSIDRDA